MAWEPTIKPLGRDEVRQLKIAAARKLTAMVDKAMEAGFAKNMGPRQPNSRQIDEAVYTYEEQVHRGLKVYAMRSLGARTPLKNSRLEALATLHPDDIREQTRELARWPYPDETEALRRYPKNKHNGFPLGKVREITSRRPHDSPPAVTGRNSKAIVPFTHKLDTLFAGQDRVYFPLEGIAQNAAPGKRERYIDTMLRTAGYKVYDYNAGLVCRIDDNRNPERLSKICERLTQLEIPSPLTKYDGSKLSPAPWMHAHELMQHDSMRTVAKNYLVLSRHPLDVWRMSTGRHWGSCLSEDGTCARELPMQVTRGCLVAYMVTGSDLNINNPSARVTLYPYLNNKGGRLFVPGRTYGSGNEIFSHAVAAVASDYLNSNAPSDTYHLVKDIYEDGMQKTITYLSPNDDAQTVLNTLNVRTRHDADGTISVTGLLTLPMLSTRLPDLSNVRVHGDVHFENPFIRAVDEYQAQLAPVALRSLEGLPRRIHGNVDLSSAHTLIDSEYVLANIYAEGDVSCPEAPLYNTHLHNEMPLKNAARTSMLGMDR